MFIVSLYMRINQYPANSAICEICYLEHYTLIYIVSIFKDNKI